MTHRMQRSAALALGALLVLPAGPAAACTTFCLHRGPELVFGKNYDWEIGDGLLLVNKRGVAKAAMTLPGERAERWTSKFGSLTFNQWGREFPSGGMNEAGLVVELMWLDATRYPARDDRPALGALEWIQYQLDEFATVAEVVRQAPGRRVVSDAKLHYLVCDRGGACAAVEFLDGRVAARSGASLPVPALANDTYADSLAFARRHAAAGAAVAGSGSLERFTRASALAAAYAPGAGRSAVEHAFSILDDVAQAHTRWSIVYDLEQREVHFKTRPNPRPRSVRLAAFDFSCATPVAALDVDAGGTGSGDVTARFTPYTPQMNRNLLARSFAAPRFRSTPQDEVAAIARHPESTSCARQP
jgi:penicillin V acylase-like amidase (Ntn superfamily)